MLLVCGIACFLSAAVVFLLPDDYKLFLPLVAGFLAGALWCCGYELLIYRPTQQFDLEKGILRVELTEYTEDHGSYGIAYGYMRMFDGASCRQKVKVYLDNGNCEYAPGDVLSFEGILYRAERQYRANLLQRGIFLTVSQKSDETVEQHDAMTPLRSMRILSHKMTARINRFFHGDEAALLSALLAGDKTQNSRAWDRALTVSGTRHITAVSGLHVSILASTVILLLGKKKGLLVAVPLGFCYAAVVGFPASVLRAVILLAFWAVSFWIKADRDPLTAWAAALLVLAAWNPFSSVSAGLLLSFSATLGILLLATPLAVAFHEPVKSWKNKLLKKVFFGAGTTLAASAAATLFTLPLNLLFFDTVPVLGLVSNLLVLWAVPYAMALGMLVILVSVFSVSAAGLIACFARLPLWWITGVVRLFGRMRFAAADSANFLIVLLCLLAFIVVFCWRGKKLSGKRAAKIFAIGFLLTAVLTVGLRMAIGEVYVGNSGGEAVILIRGDGVSQINFGRKPEQTASLTESALTRWNANKMETVLCTDKRTLCESGLNAVSFVEEGSVLLFPETWETISTEISFKNIETYSKIKTVKISGLTAELLPCDGETYAVRLIGKHFSLLDLCNLSAEQALSLVDSYRCRADILLLDDALADDLFLRARLFKAIEPKRILVSNRGFSKYDEEYYGIPFQTLDYNGATFHFVRW